MKISILCVGKIKEKYFSDAVAEYSKRMSRYGGLTVRQVADERTKEQPTEAEREAVLSKEGERLLKYMDDADVNIALDILGKKMDSVALAKWIESQGVYGKSHLQFVIGGSLGLDERVVKKSDLRLSFSDMTFPHQLMRVILAEQIYRSFRIINGEPYHK